MTPSVANALWLASCAPEAARFHASKHRVAQTQGQVLARLLARNDRSAFGRAHGFNRIWSVRDYQEIVPLASYDDLLGWINRVAEGEANVLSCEPVLLLEPTGGSSAPSKLIPCTASLKAEFARAVAPWMAGLARQNPGLLDGRAYWSLSPLASRGRRTSGGLPIGFEEDAEYFGRAQSRLIRAVQAVPGEARLVEDVGAWRDLSLLFLLRARDLSLASVWSPSFGLLLLERLRQNWDELARCIERGVLPPADLPGELRARFLGLNRPDARRAAQIRAAFGEGDAASIHARLWPRLRVLSCWADAHASSEARELASLLPQARLQGKGLLATEGVVSLPLPGREGGALAIRSHFFEFLPTRLENGQVTVDEAPLLAHELEAGRRYSVVLSTGGGLYRYKLGDVVEVLGFDRECPLLRFVARADRVSDRRGEKLHEEHVGRALQVLLDRHARPSRLAMVAAEESCGGWAYVLFIESAASDAALGIVGRELEASLRESFHYDLCRKLGQLGPLRVFRVEHGGRESYERRCLEAGQRAGDIKPCALHARAEWAREFRGKYLAS